MSPGGFVCSFQSTLKIIFYIHAVGVPLEICFNLHLFPFEIPAGKTQPHEKLQQNELLTQNESQHLLGVQLWNFLLQNCFPTPAQDADPRFDQQRRAKIKDSANWMTNIQLSHSQKNQHDNAEPCSQDYTHGGNNGTYGHKEYSSFFKTVYCLRTKQTTSKYIWHQHLTVLQADPSFQNPKKPLYIRVCHKFCWST